ncbi:hypothetical protein N7490_004725 [Penicillium lividum]|nr:hypothetical protein N7490_004725 [Penicillium lividum]
MLGKEEHISKFTMMLTCFYSCLSAGVAFVNASSVITSNTARLTILFVGALADSTMNDVFKSYADSKSEVSYTKTVNPALFQHMNVKEEISPTSDEILKEGTD